jgi:hypothetical protein
MKTWEAIWHNGYRATVQASDYTTARRKLLNSIENFKRGDKIFKIGLAA